MDAGVVHASHRGRVRIEGRFVGTANRPQVKHGMAEFVVAGRSVKSYLGVATMIGSELGLVTVMYSAQKGFSEAFSAFHIALSAGVVALIVGMTGFIVVPLRRMLDFAADLRLQVKGNA